MLRLRYLSVMVSLLSALRIPPLATTPDLHFSQLIGPRLISPTSVNSRIMVRGNYADSVTHHRGFLVVEALSQSTYDPVVVTEPTNKNNALGLGLASWICVFVQDWLTAIRSLCFSLNVLI